MQRYAFPTNGARAADQALAHSAKSVPYLRVQSADTCSLHMLPSWQFSVSLVSKMAGRLSLPLSAGSGRHSDIFHLLSYGRTSWFFMVKYWFG